MRPKSHHKEQLSRLFDSQTIATINELKNALGTDATMTVYRKLRELDYISSCSHSGKYYSLKRLAKFDHMGLWRHAPALFSSFKDLDQTLTRIVNNSTAGCSSGELEKLLGLKPNASLLKLAREGDISREKVHGVYTYFSSDRKNSLLQKMRRGEIGGEFDLRCDDTDLLMNELKAAIILFYSTLNEKQRRLYSGLESLRVGNNGDRIISEMFGVNIKTVGKGRRELLKGSINIDTIRNAGGGRKKNNGKHS